jgi:CHAT domain-containing protein/Flp pilus assembly protein TadD
MKPIIRITILCFILYFNVPAVSLSSKNLNHINIDSLSYEILSAGWNDNLLAGYAFYLTNTLYDSDKQLTMLNNLPGAFEKIYLESLIYKRLGEFHEMFNALSAALKYHPHFLPFYDELVFAAYADSSVSLLQAEINNQIPLPIEFRDYLASLIASRQGNYSLALKLINEVQGNEGNDKYFNYNLSYVYRDLGNYVKALSEVNSALNEAGSDESFVAKCYLAIGSLQYLSGNYKSAEEFYNKAYDLSVKIEDKENESVSLVDLGIMKDYEGNVENARKDYNRAVKLADEFNCYEANALAHSELGVSYSITNSLPHAKENYIISYSLYKKIGNRLRLSLLSDNIAKLYMSQFNYKASKELYEEGLKYAGENKRAQAINLTGLADIYNNLSDYTKALEYYKKASAVLSGINDIPLETQLKSGLGSLYYNIGSLKDALKNYKDENNISTKSNDVYSMAESFEKLGLLYSDYDSLSLAAEYFEKAISISSKNTQPYTQIVSALDLVALDISNNAYLRAGNLLQNSKKLSAKYGFKYLASLSDLFEGKLFEKKKNFSAALVRYQAALNLMADMNEPNIKIELNYLLARLYENEGRAAEAEKYYNYAVDLIDRISYSLYSKDEIQISYFDTKEDVYRSYADFLLNNKKYKDAFEIIDRSRSRNTTQNLVNLKIDNIVGNSRTADKLYDLEWVLNSGLYDSLTVDSVRQVYGRFRDSLVQRYPQLRNFLYNYGHESIDAVQEKLNADENLISFYSTQNTLYVFLIKKSTFDIFKLPLSKNKLVRLISKISPYFTSGPSKNGISYNQDLFSFNAGSAYELYTMILKPALAKVNRNDKIIFSLSPELSTIPFEFLVIKYDSSMSAYNYSNKIYLINSYQISYTPSIDLYIIAKENKLKNQNKILLVGNPIVTNLPFQYAERRGLTYGNGELHAGMTFFPLKYSEQEVNTIGSLFRDDKILTGTQATESNFKKDAAYCRVIHLSTHSFLQNKQPVIFFSDYHDSSDDGLLETNEIVQLKLNSDLVVLSSCNSGLGPIDESEGIIGMTKAFYEAGAKSVIVSLWPVNDEYTAKLMDLFYQNLISGMNKSEALRQAKIEFIKKYSANPYFWSAFILCGNTSDLKLQSRASHNLTLTIIYISVIVLLIALIYGRKVLHKHYGL